MNIKRTKKTINFMPYLLLLMVIIGSYLFLNTLGTKVNQLSYTELTESLNKEQVTELAVTPKSGSGVYIITGKLKNYKSNESYDERP